MTTIAIVEDNAALGSGLRKIVESAEDFRCLGVWTSAEEALKKVDAFRPQVVLMDINLEGGREGIEVARWLRKVCEAPIVFITGYTDPDTVERIHQQVPGACVLLKPVYRDRLAAAVAAVSPRDH